MRIFQSHIMLLDDDDLKEDQRNISMELLEITSFNISYLLSDIAKSDMVIYVNNLSHTGKVLKNRYCRKILG